MCWLLSVVFSTWYPSIQFYLGVLDHNPFLFPATIIFISLNKEILPVQKKWSSTLHQTNLRDRWLSKLKTSSHFLYESHCFGNGKQWVKTKYDSLFPEMFRTKLKTIKIFSMLAKPAPISYQSNQHIVKTTVYQTTENTFTTTMQR